MLSHRAFIEIWQPIFAQMPPPLPMREAGSSRSARSLRLLPCIAVVPYGLSRRRHDYRVNHMNHAIRALNIGFDNI